MSFPRIIVFVDKELLRGLWRLRWGAFNSLCLVPQRTEGLVSPGPEEVEREDKGTRTPPPQILLPLEERVTHFRDMLLERGVSTGPRAGSRSEEPCRCPPVTEVTSRKLLSVLSPAGARPAFRVHPSQTDSPGLPDSGRVFTALGSSDCLFPRCLHCSWLRIPC